MHNRFVFVFVFASRSSQEMINVREVNGQDLYQESGRCRGEKHLTAHNFQSDWLVALPENHYCQRSVNNQSSSERVVLCGLCCCDIIKITIH